MLQSSSDIELIDVAGFDQSTDEKAGQKILVESRQIQETFVHFLFSLLGGGKLIPIAQLQQVLRVLTSD